MVKPEDAYAFQNTMLICIGVGFFASIGYHVITKLPYSNGNIDVDWLAPPSPLLPPLTPSPVQHNAPRYDLNIVKKDLRLKILVSTVMSARKNLRKTLIQIVFVR